jgi:hypothetical protein
MGVKASYDMGLKSVQACGCLMPMLHKMSMQRHKVSSHTFPLPPPHLPFPICSFGNLQTTNKYAKPIGEIFPTPSLSLCSRGG